MANCQLYSKTLALQTPEIKQLNAEALWEHQSAVQDSSNVWKISIKPLQKVIIYKELLHHLSSSSPNLTSANFMRFLDAFWVLTLQREKSKPDNNAK
jgi:hypothetical protein